MAFETTIAFELARQELTDFVLAVAPPHYPTYNAPNTFDALCVRYAVSGISETRPLPVWSGACENTIYTSPEGNYAFRAWHDLTHLRLGADFSRDGEFAAAWQHQREAYLAGLSRAARQLLWIDTWGQFEYGLTHDGAFVENQLEFAWEKFCALQD